MLVKHELTSPAEPEPGPSTSYNEQVEPEPGPSGINQEIRRNLTAYHNNRRLLRVSTSSDDDDDDDEIDIEQCYARRAWPQKLLKQRHLPPQNPRIRALSGGNVRLLSNDECSTNSNMELLTAPDLQLDWLSDSTDQSVDDLNNTAGNTQNQSSERFKTEAPLQIDLTNETDDDTASNDPDLNSNQSPRMRLLQTVYGESYHRNASGSNNSSSSKEANISNRNARNDNVD